jgi:hypothetical protein
MYHLLIERVLTVMSGLIQHRGRIWADLNRMGIEQIVGRTSLFTVLELGVVAIGSGLIHDRGSHLYYLAYLFGSHHLH